MSTSRIKNHLYTMNREKSSDGFYTRQFRLKHTTSSPRSQRNIVANEQAQVAPVALVKSAHHNVPVGRPPSAPHFTGESGVDNRGDSVRPIDSNLLRKLDESFGDYLSREKSLKRVDSTPELIPRVFVPSVGPQRRSRAVSRKQADQVVVSTGGNNNNYTNNYNRSKQLPSNSKSTPFPPNRKASQGRNDVVLGKKSSRKVSWSQYQTSGDKKAKKGVRRVFEKLQIEDVVLEGGRKMSSNNSTTYKVRKEPERTILPPSIELRPKSEDEESDAFTITESGSRSGEDGDYSSDEIEYDSFLEECEDVLDELRLIIEKREQVEYNLSLDPTNGTVPASVEVKPTDKMRDILRIVARRYFETMEREWIRRRKLWLEDSRFNPKMAEKKWGRGLVSKSLRESIKNYDIMLQIPFELRPAEIQNRNPVLHDKTSDDDEEDLSRTPSGLEDRQNGESGLWVDNNAYKKVLLDLEGESANPLESVSSNISLGGAAEKSLGISNMTSYILDAPDVWEELKKPDNKQNSNTYSVWWETLKPSETDV